MFDPPVFNSTLQYGTVTDIEGNVYKTITIGYQTWMAENLRTTKYNDGTTIREVSGFSGWSFVGDSIPAFCWYYGDLNYKNVYGALYNGNAVNTNKLAPLGWHVPTKKEIATLIDYMSGKKNAGPRLRESGLSHWASLGVEGNNVSGFTALPGGARHGNIEYSSQGKIGSWWSSTIEKSVNGDRNSYFFITCFDADTSSCLPVSGLSVRCIKDE